jgi:hypothetical protein
MTDMSGKRWKVAEHGNHTEGRREAIEQEATDDAKRDEALGDDLLQRAEGLEREATEIEATDPQRAADLRHDAARDRDSARNIAEASGLAQEKVEDERPFGPESERDEGGEA